MKARLLEYGNEESVKMTALQVLDIGENSGRFGSFWLICSLPEGTPPPVGERFTIELDDARRGTALLQKIKMSSPVLIRLEGEGVLEVPV